MTPSLDELEAAVREGFPVWPPLDTSADEAFSLLVARAREMEKALREIESLPWQSEAWSEADVAVRIAAGALSGAGREKPA